MFIISRGPRGRDRMVVEFTTTCAISAYQHCSSSNLFHSICNIMWNSLSV